MRLLLDTHVVLWLLYAPSRLPQPLVQDLLLGRFEVFVSLVSAWEVAIKHSLIRPDGSRKLACSATDFLADAQLAGCRILPLASAHCMRVERLPYREHPVTGRVHSDPFDRMLIAQAAAEPLRIVTADALLALHEVDVPGLIERI